MNQVAQKIISSYADITRPANTTAYAAGDVVAASATAAVASVFGRCSSQSPGEGGIIKSVSITSSADVGTAPDLDLFLFNSAPVTFGNDNTAFAPTDAEMLNCVAAINIDGTAAAVDFIGLTTGTGNRIMMVNGLDIAFQCAPSDKSLYGVLVVRNAYAPISAEAFRIRLGVQQG